MTEIPSELRPTAEFYDPDLVRAAVEDTVAEEPNAGDKLPANAAPEEALALLGEVDNYILQADRAATDKFIEQMRTINDWRLGRLSNHLISANTVLYTPDGGVVRIMMYRYFKDRKEDLPTGDDALDLIERIREQPNGAIVEHYGQRVIADAERNGETAEDIMRRHEVEDFDYCEIKFQEEAPNKALPAAVIRKAQTIYFERQIEEFLHYKEIKDYHDEAESAISVRGDEAVAFTHLNKALALFTEALDKIERGDVGGIDQVVAPQELHAMLSGVNVPAFRERDQKIQTSLDALKANDETFKSAMMERLKEYTTEQIADMIFEKRVLDIFGDLPSEDPYTYIKSVSQSAIDRRGEEKATNGDNGDNEEKATNGDNSENEDAKPIVPIDVTVAYQDLLGQLRHAYLYRGRIGIARHFKEVGSKIDLKVVDKVKKAIEQSPDSDEDLPYLVVIERFGNELNNGGPERHKTAQELRKYIHHSLHDLNSVLTNSSEQELEDYLGYVILETKRMYIRELVELFEPAVGLTYNLSDAIRFNTKSNRMYPRDCGNVWNTEVVSIINEYFEAQSYGDTTGGVVPHELWRHVQKQAILREVTKALEAKPAIEPRTD